MSGARMTYREALRLSHREALLHDPRVFLMGEDVGRYGGSYAVSKGLLDEFGPERIRNVPLSESAFVGAGIGTALGGMRPIVEVMTVNFSLLALDQIINSAATIRHMSGGQFSIPIVIRMATGAGRQLAAQHSHSFEGWYAHIPGIKILVPATVQDARWMLEPALKDPNPILFFEHTGLYNLEEEVSDSPDSGSIFSAAVRKDGKDMTIITYGGSLQKSMKAADELAMLGINSEVIDLRSLRPLDTKTILASISKTHRAVIVDEGWKSGSLSAEIMARIMEQGFFDLDAPIARVCSE
jgi:pyruvate dehydrogenase E1 component beta subunit